MHRNQEAASLSIRKVPTVSKIAPARLPQAIAHIFLVLKIGNSEYGIDVGVENTEPIAIGDTVCLTIEVKILGRTYITQDYTFEYRDPSVRNLLLKSFCVVVQLVS